MSAENTIVASLDFSPDIDKIKMALTDASTGRFIRNFFLLRVDMDLYDVYVDAFLIAANKQGSVRRYKGINATAHTWYAMDNAGNKSEQPYTNLRAAAEQVAAMWLRIHLMMEEQKRRSNGSSSGN